MTPKPQFSWFLPLAATAAAGPDTLAVIAAKIGAQPNMELRTIFRSLEHNGLVLKYKGDRIGKRSVVFSITAPGAKLLDDFCRAADVARGLFRDAPGRVIAL